MAPPLVEIDAVTKSFGSTGLLRRKPGPPAVDRVTLAIEEGETLGIVGESGSGKSTVLRMVLRLIRPTSGTIRVAGEDVWALSGPELKALRRRMQAVFQDPSSSFNPRQTIGRVLMAPLEVHDIGTRPERRRRVAEVMEQVGLDPRMAARHPHELSGGQRQRIAIARAIILRPALLLADEPTSALDVSVQAQILNLFRETRRALGLTCIFVSHNLGVIRYVADRVAVMRQGVLVETGPADRVFAAPQHEYTRALLAAVPDPSDRAA